MTTIRDDPKFGPGEFLRQANALFGGDDAVDGDSTHFHKAAIGVGQFPGRDHPFQGRNGHQEGTDQEEE